MGQADNSKRYVQIKQYFLDLRAGLELSNNTIHDG